jgi:hypothetical protein
VVARGDTQLLVLEWEKIRRLGRMSPRISAKLFLNLAAVLGSRLAGVDQQGCAGPRAGAPTTAAEAS